MSDAHAHEYAAAAACLSDQTPSGCRLPAVGDWVTVRLKSGPTQGRVFNVGTGFVDVEFEGKSWESVTPDQITALNWIGG